MANNNNNITFKQLESSMQVVKRELNKKSDTGHGYHVSFPPPTGFTLLRFGTDGSVGESTTCARSDHTHTLPALPTSLKNPCSLSIIVDGTNEVLYDGSSSQTISISCADINAAPSEHTHNYLPIKGINTISSTTDDTVSKWDDQINSVHWFNTTNKVLQQPNQHGYLINYGGNGNVHQIWLSQPGSDMYHRGGNSSGWATSWKKILDDSNYTSIVANDSDVLQMVSDIFTR